MFVMPYQSRPVYGEFSSQQVSAPLIVARGTYFIGHFVKLNLRAKADIDGHPKLNAGETMQVAPFDSNNAFAQVRCAIKDLMGFADQENEDDVFYTANKLNSVLRMVHDNYQSWNVEAIREFVLNKHDPLRHLNAKSDKFSHRVRTIQHEMIVKFT